MKKISLCLLLSAVGSAGYACNTCGGAAANQYLGILPQLSGSFIGLQYQYRWYESYHDVTEANKAVGKEHYNTVQLWGRYAVNKCIQLYAFIPYQFNTKREYGATSTLSGIGDITVLASVQLLRPKSNSNNWQHYLQVSAGIKAPTGTYNDMVLGSGDALAPSMQAGTGSWDIVTNVNYTLRHKSAGINVEAGYTITLPNYQDYKYGNRLNGGLQAFYELDKKKLRILPAVGVRYEYTEQDYDNYTERSSAQYTGGYITYASVGCQTYYKHWGINAGYYVSISQAYGESLVRAKGKAEGGIVYLFSR